MAGGGAAEIHDAAENGDLARVRELIDSDRTLVNARNEQGNTPLHIACMRVHSDVARLLVERGADLKARNQWDQTPLIHAFGVFGQDAELIGFLIAKGADVNAAGSRGETALHWAVGRDTLEGARLLVEAGANLNAHDSAFGTPLHSAIQQNQPEMARFLIESGARLDEADPYGYTALHLAAIHGYADLAKLLIAGGADPDAGDRHRRTPLYYAARHGHRGVADVLEAAGAKADATAEGNFGRASQLDSRLAEGEAFLWYLGSFAGDGYAVKTGRHLLLFDPPGIDESPEAGLANGRLNPKELEGQQITVFITKPAWERFGLDVFKLAERLEGVDFVMAFRPEDRVDGAVPEYRLAEPGQSFSIGDIKVRAIGATLGGVAYLVEADGLKIFHGGYHVRNTPDQDEAYRRGIDLLNVAAPIDIALLPVAGHAIGSYTYGAYEYLVDRLQPRAIYLMHGTYGRQNYWEGATRLLQAGAHVEFPENEGDCFHFRRPEETASADEIGLSPKASASSAAASSAPGSPGSRSAACHPSEADSWT